MHKILYIHSVISYLYTEYASKCAEKRKKFKIFQENIPKKSCIRRTNAV